RVCERCEPPFGTRRSEAKGNWTAARPRSRTWTSRSAVAYRESSACPYGWLRRFADFVLEFAVDFPNSSASPHPDGPSLYARSARLRLHCRDIRADRYLVRLEAGAGDHSSRVGTRTEGPGDDF